MEQWVYDLVNVRQHYARILSQKCYLLLFAPLTLLIFVVILFTPLKM